MSTEPTAQQGNAAQPTPSSPTEAPQTASTSDEPVPSNRAERRRKGIDPAAAGHHGSAGQPGAARTTAKGRRINPVRRTGS
jgi:hypothetical protein